MIGIIDYGVGNLFSLKSSFDAIGIETFVSGDAERLTTADRLVLPGVGAFADAAEKLRRSGLDAYICRRTEEGTPLLGICLGMQMLFEKSYEYGEYRGLGLLKGSVVPMQERLPKPLKTPHMGWNALNICREDSKLFSNTRQGEFVYFVHSYSAVECEDSLAATVEYGIPITAAVEKGNIFGCQFHPEKSGSVGLEILRAFGTASGV